MNFIQLFTFSEIFGVGSKRRIGFSIIKVRFLPLRLFVANFPASERQSLLSKFTLKLNIVCKNLLVFPKLIEKTLCCGSISVLIFACFDILFQIFLSLQVYPSRRRIWVIQLSTVFELSEQLFTCYDVFVSFLGFSSYGFQNNTASCRSFFNWSSSARLWFPFPIFNSLNLSKFIMFWSQWKYVVLKFRFATWNSAGCVCRLVWLPLVKSQEICLT